MFFDFYKFQKIKNQPFKLAELDNHPTLLERIYKIWYKNDTTTGNIDGNIIFKVDSGMWDQATGGNCEG